MRSICRHLSVSFSLCLAASAHAAPPAVDYLFPPGGRQGTTVSLIVGGDKGDAKLDHWPVGVWSDCPGLAFKAGAKSGQFEVEIADDCPPGPHLVRFVNSDGASAPRIFVVGRQGEQLEPKSKEATPEPYAVSALPAVLNGQLAKKGEADAWAFDAEGGRWIVADLEARRLGAPIDASLQLLDPNGAVVAFGHDEYGMDPLVAYRTPKAGRYTLIVSGFAHPPSSDVRFAGSPATVYRLNLTTGPYARYAFPPVVPAGEETQVRLFGWNLPAAGDDEAAGTVVTVAPAKRAAAVMAPDVDNALRIPVSGRTAVTEVEPNDDAGQSLTLPGAVDSRLQAPGDVDRYTFTAKKGENLALSVVARSVHSPFDPVVVITDASGKELAREDDTGGVAEDPRLEWRVPADGAYVVAVSDLQRRGGPAFVYRLDVSPADPTCTAVADASSVVLKPGGSADLKVKVTRARGDSRKLKLVAGELPEGITAKTVEVPAKGGTVTLTLKAEGSVKPVNLPFTARIEGDGEPVEVVFATGIEGPVAQTPKLWLTVTGDKGKGEAAKPKK